MFRFQDKLACRIIPKPYLGEVDVPEKILSIHCIWLSLCFIGSRRSVWMVHPSPSLNSNSLGLMGIRERALIWKGHVEIKGVVGEGTLLKVKIPKLNNDK